MNDPHFLLENGKEELENALNNCDEPFELIQSLQVCDNFDFTRYSCIYPFCEMFNCDPSEILREFILQQKNLLIDKLKDISPTQMNSFLHTIQPYTLIPEFRDVIEILVNKIKPVPDWFVIPEDLKVELTPLDRLRIFRQKPSEYEEWLSNQFENALCDFEDNDDLGYLKLFQIITQFCFSLKELHKITVRFCEEKFLIDYNPMYSVIRFRLALFNSPLARIDPARPLSILVLNAIRNTNGKVDFHPMIKAAEVCPAISQIIFSVPKFTMKFKLMSYIRPFGVTPDLKTKWTPYLNTGNEQACEYMKNNMFFARIIGVTTAQGTIINENLFRTLEFCPAQVDVNYILCRVNYNPKYEFILKKWATLNGTCMIDYITSCLSRGAPIPDFPMIPQLTPQQQVIFDYAKGQQV